MSDPLVKELQEAGHELAQAIRELWRCSTCNRFTRPDPCRHCGTPKPAYPICPSCGKDAKYLEEHTGFCQACTNEHRRGSGPKT